MSTKLSFVIFQSGNHFHRASGNTRHLTSAKFRKIWKSSSINQFNGSIHYKILVKWQREMSTRSSTLTSMTRLVRAVKTFVKNSNFL